MALYDIRTYRVIEGCMEKWVSFMATRVVPFIEERGMKVDAMFHGAEFDDVYKWIRHFDDESHRLEMRARVYGSDEWQETIKPIIRRLMDAAMAAVAKCGIVRSLLPRP